MPKKTKFTRETVVEAGLAQLKEGGWEGVTPKAAARRLGASTMPIFSHFSTMNEFREAILDRAWEILKEYVSRSYTGDAWVDQGVGYVLFARDHGRLFSCMHYGAPGEVRDRRLQFWLFVSRELEGHPSFKGMSAEHVGWIRHLRSLITHGIAVTVSSGLAPIWENDEVIKRMLALCSDVLREGLAQRGDELDEISGKLSMKARERISGLR
ncbi:MAG: TetR/AcrR family transcriptional regulator [Desulfobacterales bacterium]|nr:TetR/AcrR family transcriptional regulator [Desulfobacterales bacterium]